MIRSCLAVVSITMLAACATPQKLPKPDANGAYYTWTPAEQLSGYRAMEKIFPTRVIKRGDHVAPLPKAASELKIAYTDRGEAMTTESFMEASNSVGVLVIHHDQIVLERYTHGYGPGQRWTSFSVGKSITSTLVGIALKEGKIKSLEDPLTAYLPALKGTAYEGVSVRNLLNMTTGIKWNEDYGDPNSDVAKIRAEKSVNGSDPILSYMSRLTREAPPGTKFVYKTGETHLAGSLIRAATGRNLADYLSEKVWTPYGMEKDAVWILDPAGHEYAGCCISATLRDFGRYGMFFKNGAKIDGLSVVGDDWIQQATTGSKATDRYGFFWWLTSSGPAMWAQRPPFYAQGIFGQHIEINTGKDAVVVIQSAWPTATDRPSSRLSTMFVGAVMEALN